MLTTVFTKKLLDWYGLQKRLLPWRKNKVAYRVWLAEIILQQTKVAQGLPYYERFVAKYPTIDDLAKATEQEILQLWQGLGYYTRARNLHRCAQYIVNHLGGSFPTSYAELCRLPGIGPYTGAAIASISFQEPVAVVDGNVYRVLSRLFGIQGNILLRKTKQKIQQLAQSLLYKEDPGSYNQAIMEFGALHCTPHKPRCNDCILQDDCVAYQTNQVDKLPVIHRKKDKKKRYFHYFVLTYKNKVYLKKRNTKDIWRGLYDFYLVEEPKLTIWEALQNKLVVAIQKSGAQVTQYPTHYTHILTHQKIEALFFHVAVNPLLFAFLPELALQAFDRKDMDKLPFPVLITRFLTAIEENPKTALSSSNCQPQCQ